MPTVLFLNGLYQSQMALSRLHTKRINENKVFDRQHQENLQHLKVRELKTYRTRPASYLCRWTSMPRAKAGGPGVSKIPLAVTIRTAVSNSSRQVGRYLIILHFILVWESATGIASVLSSTPRSELPPEVSLNYCH